MKFDFIKENIFFGLIMVIFGFIVSYVTDFLSGKDIDWFPKHGVDMASGTFFTSILVFTLFSKRYLKLKCKNDLKK